MSDYFFLINNMFVQLNNYFLIDIYTSELPSASNSKMLRLLSIAVVLLFLGLLELVNGECSTSNCLGCKKGCKSQDFSGFQYSGGSKILSQHNKLRRRFGVPNLKWSNTLEYQAWYTMQQDPTCSHDATNRFKNAIISKFSHYCR